MRAAGGVTTLVDMPLNSVPPTVAGLAAKRGGEATASSTFLKGGAVPGAATTWGRCGTRRARLRVFLADSGVEEALDEAGLRHAAETVASFGGLLLVHAEDPDVRGRRRPVTTTPASRRAGPWWRRSSRSRLWSTPHGHRLPHPRGAPRRGDRPARRTRRPRRRRPGHRRDLPAPDPHRRRDAPDGDAAFKCRPPLRDKQPTGCGPAARRHPRHGRLRPLALPAETATGPGGPGRRLGGELAPARAGRHLDEARQRGTACSTWCAGWPPRPPTAPTCGTRAGSPRVPTRTCACSPPTSRSSSTRPASSNGTRSRRTPDARSPASSGDLAGRATVDLGVAARAAARTSGAPMSHDFTDQPASRALGAGVVHANDDLFAARENLVTPGRRCTTAGVRAARHLRRLGDPAPAHARQRPGHRAARGARRRERRGGRHLLVRRQSPALGSVDAGTCRLPVGGGAARRALAAVRAGVGGEGRRRERVRGRRCADCHA